MTSILRSWLERLVLLVACAALAAACGFDPQAVRTGGTGSPKSTVAAGPITGLGSIVVNGIRFDETGAQVTIDGTADRPVSELQLGMMVQVRGEVDEAARIGKAVTVVATPLLAGPAGTVDVTRGEVVVLGQRVEVKAGTALQGVSGLASLQPGDSVVVYGFWDFLAGHVDATRLELRPAAAPAAPSLIGRVGTVTGSRFAIGSLIVESAGAALANLPDGIVAGRYVDVRGALDAGGILRASAIAGRSELDPVEGALTEIEGYVTDFTGVANFRVLGLPVNGDSARVTGLAAALANGALVEVEGQVVQGVLVATLIDVKSGTQQPAAPAPTTLAGAISDFVSVESFRVRDQTVSAASAAFSGGTAANLADGRNVEVVGFINGNVLVASAVAFIDPPAPEGSRLAVSGAIESFVSAMSFRVNGQAVAATASTVYTGGTVADLENGRRVDIDGLLAAGVLAASSIAIRPVETVSTVTLTGEITDFVSATSFKVNNQAITATASTQYEDGSATDLASGRRVRIEGTLQNGVVRAIRVQFAERSDTGEDAEVEGSITDFVSVSNFKVKAQLVDATAATYSHGGPADLANGLKVHVKGPMAQGVLKAKTVEIDR